MFSKKLIINSTILSIPGIISIFISIISIPLYIDNMCDISIIKNSIKLSRNNLKGFSAALIIADHDLFDYKFISENSKFVFDSRNVYKNKKYKNCKNIIFV